MTTKLEQAQHKTTAKTNTIQHQRALKTEISQTPHDWFASVVGLAQSTATLTTTKAASPPSPLAISPLADSSQQPKSTSSSARGENESDKLVVAKAKQAINRAKLHAFVEKLKVIHYHATSQPLTTSKSTLSPVKEEDEGDEEKHTQQSKKIEKPSSRMTSSPTPTPPPPTKIEALQIITNALDALGSDMVFSIGVVTEVDNYRTVTSPLPHSAADDDVASSADEDQQLPKLEHKASTAIMEHVLVELQQELVALVVTARELVLQADKDNQTLKEQLSSLQPQQQTQQEQDVADGEVESRISSVKTSMDINIEAKLESLAEAIDDVAVRYESALEKQEQRQLQKQQKSSSGETPSATGAAAAVPTPGTTVKSRQTAIALINENKAGVGRSRSSKLDILLDEPIIQTVANLTLNDLNTKLRHIAHRLVILPNQGRISEEKDDIGEVKTTEEVAEKPELRGVEQAGKQHERVEENAFLKAVKKDVDEASVPTTSTTLKVETKKSTTTPVADLPKSATGATDKKPAVVTTRKAETTTVQPAESKKEIKVAVKTNVSPPLKPSQSIKPTPSSTPLPPKTSKSATAAKKSTASFPSQQYEKPLVQLQRQLVMERQVTNTILQQLNVLSDDASIPHRLSLHKQQQHSTGIQASPVMASSASSPPSVVSSSPQTRRQLEQIAATRAAIDHFKQEALVQRAQVSPPLPSPSPPRASDGARLTAGDTAGLSVVPTSPEGSGNTVLVEISLMSEPVTIEAIAVEQRIRADLLSNINQLITANVVAGSSNDVEMADFTTQVRILSPDKQLTSTAIPSTDHEAVRAGLEQRIKTLSETMQAETFKLNQHHKRLRIFFERKLRDLSDNHTKVFVMCAQRLQQVVTRCNQHAEDILYAVRVHLPENVSHNVPLTVLQVDPTQLQDDMEAYFPEIYNELDRVMSATRFMVKAAVHQMDVKLADVYEEIENAQNGRHSSLGGPGGKRRTVNAADDAEYQRLVGALQQMDLMLSDEKRNQALEMADKTRKLEQLMRDYAVLEQTSAKMKDQLVQQLDEKQLQISKVKKECVQMKRIIDGQREKMSQLYDLLDARKRELQRAVVLKCSDLRRACEQLHFAYEQQAIDLEVYEALRECTQIVRHLPQMQLCSIFERFVKYAYLRTNQQHLADDAVQRNLKLDFATRLKLTAVERRISERNEQLEIDTRRTRHQRDEILGELSDTYTQLGLIVADRQLFDLNQLVLLPRKKPLKLKSRQRRRSSTGERTTVGRFNLSMPNQDTIAALYNLSENETLLAASAAAAKATDETQWSAEHRPQTQPANIAGAGGGDRLLYVRNALNAAETNANFVSATYRKPGCDTDDPSLYVKGLALDADKTREIVGKRKWTLTTPDGLVVEPQQPQQQFSRWQSEEQHRVAGKKPPFVYAQPYGVAYDINWHRIHGLRAAAAAADGRTREQKQSLSPLVANQRRKRPLSANNTRISYPLAQSGLVYGDVDVNDVESVEAEGQVKTYVGTNLMRTPFVMPPAVQTYSDRYNVRAVLAVPPLDNYDVDDSVDEMKAMDKREHVLQLIEQARYRHAYNTMLQKQQRKMKKGMKILSKTPQVGASSPDLLT